MNLLVIGSGGREHALVWKLKQSPLASKVFCAPGNPAIAQIAETVPLAPNDLSGLKKFALEHDIGLTVVGPEEPLALGIADLFEKSGLRVFGPGRHAAQLESSKAFAKQQMARFHIPTAAYREFVDLSQARAYVRKQGAPIVVKADGLAAGKGVTVALTLEAAEQALTDALQHNVFGDAGARVLVEECLTGEELTVMAIIDGETVLPLMPSQDHKPVFDGDKGPNTGGMGAYAPVARLEAHRGLVESQILKPLVCGMAAEGRPFRGVLYVGLMITEEGPKVIEFNVRFGDPETQAILPLLKTDLLEVLLASQKSRLDRVRLEWYPGASVCVIAAAKGYPGAPVKGRVITLPETLPPQVQIFYAGVGMRDGQLVTSGGRVLGVSAQGTEIADARQRAYSVIEGIAFQGMHFRSDIGLKAI